MTLAHGLLTLDEINSHLDLEERNGDLAWPELVDARAASTDLSADQVRQLVDRAAGMMRSGELGPIAIVTGNDVVYGMSRMYSMRAEGIGVRARVFRDMESAAAWLDEVTGSPQPA